MLTFPQLAQALGPLRFEHVPLVGAADTLVVPLGDQLKDWRKSKKTMQILLADDIAEKQLVYKHPGIQESIQLHSTQVQLHKAFMTGPVNAKAIGFVANPVGVCVLQHFVAGSLVLKPCGPLFLVKDQDKDMVGKFGVDAPKMISEFNKVDDKTVLVPFWYVKPTMDEELVNMQLEKEQCGSLELPCYVNTKDLEPGDLLLCESEMLAKKRKRRKESQVPLLEQLPKVAVAKKPRDDVSQFHQLQGQRKMRKQHQHK